MGCEKNCFVEKTIGLCPECLKSVDAKIIEKNGMIFIERTCEEHGFHRDILEENSGYHLRKREFDKPGTDSSFQTCADKGCPFDCGLCPSHKQHTCNALIEVTDACDLKCPVCYASSGERKFLDLKEIENMMDFFQEAEKGKAEILQISGGEPTMHPDILKILGIAKAKNFKYVMLNTNGLRIARDEEFVRELSKFRGKFEIYLQFDGFDSNTYEYFRGRDILDIKLKAIENLQKYKIPITLVSTIKRGVNDKEIGKIVDFGMNTDFIRGINFQPIAYFGRGRKVSKNRITLSGVIREIENQVECIEKGDIVPLPCNVERVAVAYFFKSGGSFIPLTRNFDVKSYLPLIDNTFAFDADSIMKGKKRALLSGALLCDCMKGLLGKADRILPEGYLKMSKEEKMAWWDLNSFRISVTSFVDAYNFDLRSMQKECVHMISPDLKRIPFSAWNMIHRKKYK